MISNAIFRIILIGVFASCGVAAWAQEPIVATESNANLVEDLKEKSLQDLEQRLSLIDQRLSRLSQYSLRSGIGAIGYRANARASPGHAEWFEIELDSESPIDEVVLIPNVMRDEKLGFAGNAFPNQFRVVVGRGRGKDKQELASVDVDNDSPLRIAPLIVPMNRVRASWVRIEVSQLPKRSYDNLFIFQFAEIMVFSNYDNVALRQPVTTSSNAPNFSPAWDQTFAVDGFVPYLMHCAQGEGRLPFVSSVGIGPHPSLIVDLQKEALVSSVNLHLVDQGDTVPQSFAGDFGIPGKLTIEGANNSDFSDAKILCQWLHKDLFDCGPIKMFRFPATSCRYVRLTAGNPYHFDHLGSSGSRIGLSEIEVVSDGNNVALEKSVTANFRTRASELERLTDGSNRYGRIIPVRDWLSELSLRNDLEAARPLVEDELSKRYQRQRQNLNLLIGLALLLAIIAIWVVLLSRSLRQRAILKTREQISADLHDELGANFHAIGLISDLADASVSDPVKIRPLLQRIRELTERSGKAAVYCVNMLEAKGLYDNLVEDMKRTSARVTADLNYEFVIEGEEELALGPRQRIGLFLFHQECLINAIRHSGASEVKSIMRVTKRSVNLNVSDNGAGLGDSSPGPIPEASLPRSLARRARLLGAKLEGDCLDRGGLSIELTVPQEQSKLASWIKGCVENWQ